MENNDKAKFSDEYYQKEAEAIKIRGEIIQLASIMEVKIDVIIGRYFCATDDLANELLHVVLPSERLTLTNKAKIVHFIIENHYLHYYQQDKNLFKEINLLIEIRNQFAHRLYIQSAQVKEGEITLHTFKTDGNKMKVVEEHYSKEKLDVIRKMFNNVVQKLFNLGDEIKNK